MTQARDEVMFRLYAPPEIPEPLPDPEWGYLKIVKLFNK